MFRILHCRYEEGSYSGGRCKNQRQKDVASLKRQLDRASQFAKELSQNNVDTEAYKVGTHIEEKSSHRVKEKVVSMTSIIEDLSGSDEDDDNDASENRRHIRSSHRKRKCRSKAFEESLKKAKMSNMTVHQVHRVHDYRVVFEIEHSNKIRLVEIGETVECNCSFASGRNLCVHIIWVMLKILNVNENNEVLHQKVHSRKNIKELLQKFSSTSKSASSESTSQGMVNLSNMSLL